MNYRFTDTDTVKRTVTRARVKSVAMKDLSKLENVAATIDAAEETLAKLKVERDKLIAAARKDGYEWPALAVAARMSRQGVDMAGRRANKGVLPVPRQRS